MKPQTTLSIFTISLLLLSCSSTTTNSTTTIESDTSQQASNSSTQNTNEQHKNNAELALEGVSLALEAVTDIKQRQKINDSIREANKDKMFAFQIGLKISNEKDAFDLYFNLVKAGIPQVYVFKVARKEYYIVQYEAKEENELLLSQTDFKAQLGDLGNSGIKIINLNTNFCPKQKSVALKNDEADGEEIKCLICD